MPELQRAMLGFFAYLGVCFVVASVFTILYALTRPIRQRDTLRSWRVLFVLFVTCTLLPYGWAEIMTRIHGTLMKASVENVMDELKVNGGLKYYKVLMANDKSARVIAVGVDRESWGGTENPVVAIQMVKNNGKWTADSYTVVNSLARNKDSFTLPPYW